MSASSSRPTPPALPTVGAFTASCLLVSNVVGSGIFTTTGFMARDLGEPWLILALWAVGAFIALAGAMCYGELGAALPHVGGDYLYLREAYGPLAAFLSGWVSFTVGFGAAVAAGAMSFASYVQQAAHLGELGRSAEVVIALLLVWTLTAIHLAGVTTGGTIQRLLTIAKVGAIFALVGGAVLAGRGDWAHLSASPLSASPTPGLGTVAASLIFVLYAYTGWNAAGYIAGELDRPARTLPRTMVAGMVFVGAIYLALNLVYLYALPVETLAAPPILPVAEKAAVALFGVGAATFIALLLCVSIAAAVSAMIWAGPRVYVALARDGLLPVGFACLGARGGAPGRAILLQSVWTTGLILTGTFEHLVVYAGLVLTAFSALTVSALLVLRVNQPTLPRPYRVPLYPLTPLLYLTASAAIVLYATIARPNEGLWAAGTILAGLLAYYLGVRPRKHG